MKHPPDIVPDVSEDRLREIYGADADEIIAFKRFLAIAGPAPEPGTKRKIVLPDHWFKYAHGELSSREAIEADDRARDAA